MKLVKQNKIHSMITLRSSTAEYLAFAAAKGEQKDSIELRYEDENLWLTQKLMAELYGVSVAAINQHLKTLLESNEINDSVIKEFLITAVDGKNYATKHYNLNVIISVGFKIENDRAVQFRKWAREIVKEYTIKGFAMDDERLKQGGSIHKVGKSKNLMFQLPKITSPRRSLQAYSELCQPF